MTLMHIILTDQGYMLLALLPLFFWVYQNAKQASKYSKGLPLVRERPGKRHFSLRTRWAYYNDCVNLYRDAYYNFSKKNIPVWIPTLGTRNEIILPQSCLKWVLTQPKHRLDIWEAYVDINLVKPLLGHNKYITDPWQGLLVQSDLNKALHAVVLAMNDELKYAFDAQFGTDEVQWVEVDHTPTINMIIAQAASRFTVGLPLCRDEDYLRDVMSIVDGMVLNAAVIGSTPHFLRPLIGFVVSRPTREAIARLKRKFEPLFQQRMKLLKYDKDDPDHVEPLDQLQMMMRFAQKHRPEELEIGQMTSRLCMANFGAIHQTSIAVSNMILNIVASDTEHDTIAQLRGEAVDILGPGDNDDGTIWTKAKIAKLVKADSVARETLRMNAFANRSVFRKVIADGVQTPDGMELPKGTILSFLSQPMNTDPEIFEDPLRFDPWRFSRSRKYGDAGSENRTFVSTTSQMLNFGRGKHACPGRFLVDFELKMIISHVLTNYDIKLHDEYGGKRPANRWLVEALFPPTGARLMVRPRRRC